jgi:hypothetical protein
MNFEGKQPALEYAQTESKKQKDTSFYVLISRAGGIHYRVEKSIEVIPIDSSVLCEIKNGEIVEKKGKE